MLINDYKICSKCEKEKPRDAFSERLTSKDGRRHQCRTCVSERQKILKICGIYKITSPTGKIYIGQSKDIKTRWSSYRTRSCPSQIKLDRSLEKYGVENHIFEIIEECSEENLNICENYWQIFYDVTGRNGLNCHLVKEDRVYVNKGNGVRSRKRNRGAHVILPNIIDILDIENGVYLYSVIEASTHTGIPKSHLSDMLRGKGKNKSNLIKGEDYEKGFLPNNLFKSKEGKTRVYIKPGMEVIDFSTGKILGYTTKVANTLGIKDTTLRAYLNGYATNNTNLIYKKDYDMGYTPQELVINYKNKI